MKKLKKGQRVWFTRIQHPGPGGELPRARVIEAVYIRTNPDWLDMGPRIILKGTKPNSMAFAHRPEKVFTSPEAARVLLEEQVSLIIQQWKEALGAS